MAVSNISGCIGCKSCVSACPMDVFRIDLKSNRSKAVYSKDCQLCHLCEAYCPVGAILLSDKRTIAVPLSFG